MSLKVKSADSSQFDLVSLGECMIRLSPAGHGRIEFAPALERALALDQASLIAVPIDYRENHRLTETLGEVQLAI